MISLSVTNEFAALRSVVVGIAQSNGGLPDAESCYDPKSLRHVLAGTYPLESDMIAELDEFVAVLQKYDVKVFRPEVIQNYNQIFARDIGFVIDDTFVKSNILPDRADELRAIQYIIDQINPAQVIELPEYCHVEGGDVIVHGDNLFIGTYYGSDYADYITARTNKAAVEKLKEIFPNKTIRAFELKKSKTDPLSNALHLDCCFQPLGRGKAIIHREGFLYPQDAQWLIDYFGSDQVFEIDALGMTKMQSNVFSISESVVVSEKHFTALNHWLRHHGFTVEVIRFAEISKQGGLLRCSTLPLQRI